VKNYKIMLIMLPLALLVATLTTIFARGDITIAADKLTAAYEVQTLSNEPKKIINTGIANDSQADNALDRTGSENAEPGETALDANAQKATDKEVSPTPLPDDDASEKSLVITPGEEDPKLAEPIVAQTITPTPTPADDDNDGFPNYIEELAGFDPQNADTDGDGLDDYYEVITAKTYPIMIDSNRNGISDGEDDPDEDGLTNLREYMLGTNPQKNDSDRDGLSDYDEAETYGSDPLVEDTDGDGLTDLDESILGLDPNESKTNGSVSDSERTFDQVLSEASYGEGVLKAEDPLIPSISANVRGVIDRHIRVQEGTDIYNNNRAVIAKPIDIWSNLDGAKVILKYECSDEIEDADEFLKGLSIFEKTLEEGLVPLESVVEGRTISAEVNAEGVYLVIDVDNFLMGFGIDVLGNLK
jgi:hypothetical protein